MTIYDLLELFIDSDDQEFYVFDNEICDIIFNGTKPELEDAGLEDLLYCNIESIDNMWDNDARLCLNVTADEDLRNECVSYMLTESED